MSGPKTSRYTLTPEQRRILEEQRKIERRKAVASENIKRKNKRLLQIGAMFSSEKKVAAELNERCGNDGGFLEKISELEALTAPIATIVPRTNNDDVTALENTAKTVSECVAKAERIVRELSDIASHNEVSLRANLNEAIDQGFSTSFADIKTTAQISVSEAKDKMRVQLIQMKNNSVLSAEMKAEIQKVISGLDTIQDEAFLKNYSALTVSPLLKRCKQFLDEYENCHEEFDMLYSEYVAICDLYCYVAQEYPCCAASIEKIKSEIQRIKDTVAEDDEQAYISDCLDEVMEEMGYIVLGSREVTKKNGKHFRNELYTYAEGTAVNVTYSSDGRIAMELGGIDAADRLPSDCETAVLCESMERFCDDFKEIEKRLLRKGVILADRISMLPPSAEYAQIINTSDYEMKSEAEKLKTKKQRRAATKQKTIKKE